MLESRRSQSLRKFVIRVRCSTHGSRQQFQSHSISTVMVFSKCFRQALSSSRSNSHQHPRGLLQNARSVRMGIGIEFRFGNDGRDMGAGNEIVSPFTSRSEFLQKLQQLVRSCLVSPHGNVCLKQRGPMAAVIPADALQKENFALEDTLKGPPLQDVLNVWKIVRCQGW